MARPSVARTLRAVTLGVLLVGTAPMAARAQTRVAMIVADSVTGRPIPGVLLELVTPAGSPVWRGTSDDAGRADARVDAGDVLVSASAAGYRTIGQVLLTVPAQDEVAVRVLLSPAPLMLDSLAVATRSRTIGTALDRSGFTARRERRRFGFFLDQSEIEERGVISPSELLRRMSGIRVAIQPSGSPVVYMRSATRPQLSASGVTAQCGPRVIRDGVTIHEGGLANPAPIDELVQLADIAGIEVYRSTAEVPPEFSMGAGGCGAIVIWSR